MLGSAIEGGLLALLAIGTWQLRRTRQSTSGAHDELFAAPRFVTRRDHDFSFDPKVTANLGIAWLEMVVVGIAGALLGVLLTMPGTPPLQKGLFTGTFLVGSALLGHSLYVRLGFPVRGQTVSETGQTAGDARTDLAATVGEPTATDFDAIRSAMATARGDATPAPDVLTIGLLASAYNEDDVRDVRCWAARTGLASPATFDARRAELVAAGVLAEDSFRLRVSRIASTEPADVAAMATSLLA
ncbi:hypothetical protein [Haloarchaeobius sp. DFWS5]|uniref:hypothetical protein n=1 Tax=Haloarchaeobius sp. DFWS5 TaxID=3446114 RepID=UPI003EB6F480